MEQCVEKVFPRETWGWCHPYQCTRKGKVQRDGKWYCGVHDPEAVKAKEAERQKKRAAEWKKTTQAWDREAILRRLAKGIPTEELEQYQLVKERTGH